MTEACPSRKVPYTSRGEAKNHLSKNRIQSPGMHVYRCPICSDWHIGHRPVKKR